MAQLSHDYWKDHRFDYMDISQPSDVSAFQYTVLVCHSCPSNVRTEASSGELEQKWGFLKGIKRVTKSPARLQGNGLKLKNTVPGATSPGHTWSLSPGLLASRLPCHSTPKQQTLEPTANGRSSREAVPNFQDLMPDDLRWS